MALLTKEDTWIREDFAFDYGNGKHTYGQACEYHY